MERIIKVPIRPNSEGYVGRECPECNTYFKIKPGTGLTTGSIYCPYCGHYSKREEFATEYQNKYAGSVAREKIINDFYQEIDKGSKELRKLGMLKRSVRRHKPFISTKYYKEKELETYVVCANCGLNFAVYGIFANCPDCNNLNALTVFEKSIEAAKKMLKLIESIDDNELIGVLLKDALSGGVSAFDALGKFLRSRYTYIFPEKPKNLFQNLTSLDYCLRGNLETSLTDILGEEEHGFIVKMFQVRHIYEHNLGVIDEDFIRKLPAYRSHKGRKYVLDANETSEFLDILLKTGQALIVSIRETREEP